MVKYAQNKAGHSTSGNKTMDELHDIAHEAGKKSRHLVDHAGKEFSDTIESVISLIREKPIQSGAVMLGIGLLLGMLFRRR